MTDAAMTHNTEILCFMRFSLDCGSMTLPSFLPGGVVAAHDQHGVVLALQRSAYSVADDVEHASIVVRLQRAGDLVVEDQRFGAVAVDHQIAADLVAGAHQWRPRANLHCGGVA